MKKQLNQLIFPLTILAIMVGVYLTSMPALAQEGIQLPVEVVQIAPDDPADLAAAEVPQLSTSEKEALLRRKLELREQMGDLVDNNPVSPPGLLLDPGIPTEVSEVDESQFHGDPSAFVIGRNKKNTNANDPALGSTLAEPAAANNAKYVFAAGNFDHAEVSRNVGNTWTNVPLPGGPADAPILCCDHDVMIDDARRVVFHSALYINNALSNGVVRIFVRRTLAGPGVPPLACSYTIDPAGSSNNILPDFPHLGLTKRFLYLSINAVGAGGGFARMYRYNIDQMADCVAASGAFVDQSFNTFGQRVWRPAEGTNNIETMHWIQHNNNTTVRIFRWSENVAGVAVFDRVIAASTFSDPDCRGGVGDYDWIGSLNAGISGFQKQGTAAPGANGGPGVLAFYWQVGPDGAHPQGHVHAAVFDLASLTLLAQPHIWNAEFCFGFPQVSANKRGDIGITLSAGGRKGGGGGSATAARGYVGLDDEFTSGLGTFGTVFLVASGSANRSDGRHGDYYTIHPHEPCEKWFTATSYARQGQALSDINSRYVNFGRNQSLRCYDAHKFTAPRGQ